MSDTSSVNPYRTSQQTLALPTTMANSWKEGPYLVVHASRTVLPARCLYCDADAAWSGRINIRKPASKLMIVGIVAFGAMAVGLFAVIPKARVTASLCAAHAESRRNSKLLVYVPLGLTLLSLLVLFLAGFGVLPSDDNVLTPVFLMFVVTWLLTYVGVAVDLIVGRPVTIFREQRNYFWLAGVYGEYLVDLPDIAEAEHRSMHNRG